MLPPPKSFNAYSSDAQRMILDWADRQTRAVFDDESKRQDRLVEAEIRQAVVGQGLSAFVILASIAASVVVGIMTGNAAMSGRSSCCRSLRSSASCSGPFCPAGESKRSKTKMPSNRVASAAQAAKAART